MDIPSELKAEIMEKLRSIFGDDIHKNQIPTIKRMIDNYLKCEKQRYCRKDLRGIADFLPNSLKEIQNGRRTNAKKEDFSK